MRLEKELKQIGLEEKEAKVYLAALELGPASIQHLTKKSGIKRSTVYEMIKNLKGMGFMSETAKGKRKLIVAAEPESLKRGLKEKERLLAEIMPELKSLSNVGSVKPKIMFYEGRDGVKEIYYDTLKAKRKMAYWVSPIQSIVEYLGEDFLIKYVDERTKKGIWIKSLHITSKKFANYKYLNPATYEKTLRKVKFTPPDINISNTIAIYDNKVAIISSQKEGLGFIVESEEYANTMKIFYNTLWNISRTYEEMGFIKKENSV